MSPETRESIAEFLVTITTVIAFIAWVVTTQAYQ
jgi:hypothetical protein